MGTSEKTMTNEQYACSGGGRDTFIGRDGPVIRGTGHNTHRNPSKATIPSRRYTGHVPAEGGGAINGRGQCATGQTPRDCATVDNDNQTSSEAYGEYYRQTGLTPRNPTISLYPVEPGADNLVPASPRTAGTAARAGGRQGWNPHPSPRGPVRSSATKQSFRGMRLNGCKF